MKQSCYKIERAVKVVAPRGGQGGFEELNNVIRHATHSISAINFIPTLSPSASIAEK